MVRMIALIRIHNFSEFARYRELVPATLEPFNGELRFRAERPITLDDENELGDFSQIALFWFPTKADMIGWYESDAYHDLLDIRANAASFTILGMEPDE